MCNMNFQMQGQSLSPSHTSKPISSATDRKFQLRAQVSGQVIHTGYTQGQGNLIDENSVRCAPTTTIVPHRIVEKRAVEPDFQYSQSVPPTGAMHQQQSPILARDVKPELADPQFINGQRRVIEEMNRRFSQNPVPQHAFVPVSQHYGVHSGKQFEQRNAGYPRGIGRQRYTHQMGVRHDGNAYGYSPHHSANTHGTQQRANQGYQFLPSHQHHQRHQNHPSHQHHQRHQNHPSHQHHHQLHPSHQHHQRHQNHPSHQHHQLHPSHQNHQRHQNHPSHQHHHQLHPSHQHHQRHQNHPSHQHHQRHQNHPSHQHHQHHQRHQNHPPYQLHPSHPDYSYALPARPVFEQEARKMTSHQSPQMTSYAGKRKLTGDVKKSYGPARREMVDVHNIPELTITSPTPPVTVKSFIFPEPESAYKPARRVQVNVDDEGIYQRSGNYNPSPKQRDRLHPDSCKHLKPRYHTKSPPLLHDKPRILGNGSDMSIFNSNHRQLICSTLFKDNPPLSPNNG